MNFYSGNLEGYVDDNKRNERGRGFSDDLQF